MRALPNLMLILDSLFHRLLHWSGRQAQGVCLGGSLTEILEDQFTLFCLSKIIWNKIKRHETSTIRFHSELMRYTCGASYSFWLLKLTNLSKNKFSKKFKSTSQNQPQRLRYGTFKTKMLNNLFSKGLTSILMEFLNSSSLK